jgi:hypothetical protein
MKKQSLQTVADALTGVGWFVPPYISVGLLETVSDRIVQAQGKFSEDDLERVLAFIYTPDRMSSMVVSRYPQYPVVSLYQETIAEAITAHFSGLRHVAVGGLMPVVEGIGRGLARQRGLKSDARVKTVFEELLTHARNDVVRRNIGATQEIADMLDAFLHFLKKYFFEDSRLYPLLDKTNRHGILHGAYKDADYGRPVNFYKAISAVDILTFVSMLQTAKMSGFAPDRTTESSALAERYLQLEELSKTWSKG